MLSARNVFLIILLTVSTIKADKVQPEKPGFITWALSYLNPKAKIIGASDMRQYVYLHDRISEVKAKKIGNNKSKLWPDNFEEEFKLGQDGTRGTVPFTDDQKDILKAYRDKMGQDWLLAMRKHHHILNFHALGFAQKFIKTIDTTDNRSIEGLDWQAIQDNNIIRAARPVKIVIGLLAGGAIVAGLSCAVYKKIKARKQRNLSTN